MPRLTQIELAKRLGVSQQAVSFALNNSGTLASDTRARIIKEANRLGYRPNAAARSMQKGRMGNAAFVCEDGLRTFLPPALLSGVHEGLDAHGHHLILHPLSDDKLKDPDYMPAVMRELSVDGIIILFSGHGESRLRDWLRTFDIPVIWINRKDSVNCVYPDDFDLGYRGTKALIERGHRRISYMGPGVRSDSHFSEVDRLAGYQRAMEEIGEQVDCLSNRQSGKHAQELFAKGKPRSTGFFCYGAEDAAFIYMEALKHGLRIPEDVSILTLGNARAQLGTVRLDVLRIPFYWIGMKAVDLLEKRFQKGNRDVRSVAVQHPQFDAGETVQSLA